MKLTWSCAIAFVLAAMLATVAPVHLGAQAQRQKTARYAVINLGTLGGTSSIGNTINNRGWSMGNSNLADDEVTHAALWARGVKLDLGTLGGPNSAVLFPNRNDKGEIVGVAETADLDPFGEAFSCAAFFPTTTHHICRGFVWREGNMRALGTFGGNNSFGSANNNRGQVVGWAENTVHDPSCVSPQVLQFRAARWEPNGGIRELSPLEGDSTSAATAINNRGQVVGISGICDVAVGRFSAAHAVIWEKGVPIDIGNLGGRAWNTPVSINNRGEVAGFSDLPGDESGSPNFHAFLWTKEQGIRDLGTLPGDAISEATGINDRGQVVGVSFAAGFMHPRAFLWQDGVMTDLNTVIPPDAGLKLILTGDINNRGEITGEAVDLETGEAPAFLAIPSDDDNAEPGSTEVVENRSLASTPEHVSTRINRRFIVGSDR